MSRNMQLPIRCTYEELCQIRQDAHAHNMNVSEYIRYLVAKERKEIRKMRVYLVVCNGKISSEAYHTLEQAQKFCEIRGAKQDVSAWVYTTDEDVYMITDVQVIPRTPQNDEVRE